MEKRVQKEKGQKLSKNAKIILYVILGAVIVLLLFNLGKPVLREEGGLSGGLRSVGFEGSGDGSGSCDYYTDCDDGNECTDDICNSEGKCEHTNKADGVACDPPGISKDGFCKGGKCLVRNCANVYGKDYEKCGKKGPGLLCCSKGNCCTTWLSAVCCKKNERCSSYLGEALCTPNYCPASAPKLCKGKHADFCCPADSYCITIGGFAECGDPGTTCPDGESPCPNDGSKPWKDGIFCCNDATETCVLEPTYDYPFCQPKNNKCEKGFSPCFGKGGLSYRKRCCKDGSETCRWNPDGYPICECLETGEVGGSCDYAKDCKDCQFCKDKKCVYGDSSKR